jgi:acyl-CoA synthetase (NDP forming)
VTTRFAFWEEPVSLDQLLRPASIAVVGASNRRTSNGFIVTRHLLDHGYAGKIFPVHPRLERLMGLRVCSSLRACNDRIDLAVLMVRAERIPELYLEAAELGVGAVSIAGDLPEDSDARQVIAETLADGGPRILGPGSMGSIDRSASVMASMSSALRIGSLPAGGLSVLSQSGGMLGSLVNRAADHGIGISKAVSLGQEFDVGLGELIGYLAEDDTTATIACVIEGIRDADAFVDGVRRAHAVGKQVSILRIGRSQAGRRSALAHSGVLAAPNRVYDGLFDQLAVLEASSLDELLAVIYAQPSQPISGPGGVGAVSLSGGSCVAFADACDVVGVRLSTLASETVLAVAGSKDPAHLANPVDLVSNAVGPEVTEEVLTRGLRIVEADPSVAAVVYADSLLLPIDEVADTLIEHHHARSKPLVVAWDLGSQGARAYRRLQRARVPTFRSSTMAARWLALVLRSRPLVTTPTPDPEATRGIADALARYDAVATDAELIPLLSAAGIPTVPGVLVYEADDAGVAFDEFGGAVALKVISPRVLHRHSAGALALALTDRRAVVESARRLLDAHPLRDERDALLVQPMVPVAREYFLGVQMDATFGPMLLFGRGGVDVELDAGVQVRRLPVTGAEIASLVAHIDQDAPFQEIVDVAARVCAIADALGDRLTSLEINPLVVPADGRAPIVALDALAILATGARDRQKQLRSPAHQERHRA